MKPTPAGAPARPRTALELVALEDRLAPAALTPDEVRRAYGVDSIPAFAADGAGQTIAVVVNYHDPSLAGDVGAFNAKYGTPANQSNARPAAGPGAFLRVVNQTGGPALPPADAG